MSTQKTGLLLILLGSTLLPVKVKNSKATLGKTEINVAQPLDKDGNFSLVVRPEKFSSAVEKKKDENYFNGTLLDSIFRRKSAACY